MRICDRQNVKRNPLTRPESRDTEGYAKKNDNPKCAETPGSRYPQGLGRFTSYRRFAFCIFQAFLFSEVQMKKVRMAEKAPNWKGGIAYHTSNKHDLKYRLIYNTKHPRRRNNHIFEHILIAESVLNKRLPDNAMIHHIDGDGTNNNHSNLLICEKSLHQTIHARQRAIRECSNPNWRKCHICKSYDELDNLRKLNNGSFYHKHCDAMRKRR